jgi:hypothetical protein
MPDKEEVIAFASALDLVLDRCHPGCDAGCIDSCAKIYVAHFLPAFTQAAFHAG